MSVSLDNSSPGQHFSPVKQTLGLLLSATAISLIIGVAVGVHISIGAGVGAGIGSAWGIGTIGGVVMGVRSWLNEKKHKEEDPNH